MREILASPPFQLGGVVRQGNWSVIPLNTWAPGDAGGTLSPDELEFLDRSLEGASAGHCLVTLHHQPVPMGSRWLDSVPLRNADEFLAVCDRHANLRGIVWGHVHQESDRERRGVRLLSTPATCAQFTPGSDTFALDSRPPGYRWIELQPDGRIDTSVVWVAHGK
jgi:Icc protein